MGNKTRLVGLVATATTFASMGVPIQAAAASEDGQTDPRLVIARGTVTASNLDALVATASLDAATSVPSDPGTPVETWDLPAGSVHLEGDAYTIELDPTTVPETNIEPDGLVTLAIGFTDANTGATSHMITSARAVSSSTSGVPETVDGSAWVDPLASWEPAATNGEFPVLTGTGEQSGATEGRLASRIVGAPVEPTDAVVEMHAGAAKRVKALAADRIVARPGDSSAAAMMGGAQCVWGDKKRVWATVGTSYPIRNSRLQYGRSTSSTFGAAVTYGNGWDASGTNTTGDSWGQQFTASGRNRSYRVAVQYQRQNCLLSSGIYSHSHTIPRKQPGFTRTHRLGSKPNFTHCGPVAGGEWWRGSTRGTDYQLSYGVKSERFIGIDLSARRAYSSQGRLSYWFGKSRRMCGSNDSPAQARAILEKRRRR